MASLVDSKCSIHGVPVDICGEAFRMTACSSRMATVICAGSLQGSSWKRARLPRHTCRIIPGAPRSPQRRTRRATAGA